MNLRRVTQISPARLISLLSVLFFTLIFSQNIQAQDAEAGEKLFNQNCATCHTITDQKMTGPGLKGVFERIPSEEWFVNWVTNPQEMIDKGDDYANEIKDFSPTQMTSFEYLSEEEIMNIAAYIKNPPVKEEPATAAADGATAEADKGVSGNTILYILIGLAILLFVLIGVLSGVKKSLHTLVNEKKNLPAPEDLSLLDEVQLMLQKNKKIVALVIFVFILWLGKLGWDGLMGIGVYQGYQPEQPIAFSHEVHAGKNGIQCVYCHFGAEKGKVAGIPPANVCMNCHKAVQEGTNTGTKEIAKIYEALDYDPLTQTYGDNPKPIKWVKVHNLPDHVYFNHSQHVVVGDVECQTCHGPVETFTVGKQHEDLTMGWCINCHRETQVKVAGNAYYDNVHDMVKDVYKDVEPITVEKIGGLECAKCHY